MRGHSVWRGDISIHALREEGDEQRRTGRPYGRCISIHALREEGDVPVRVSGAALADFYPRPPRGGRLVYDLPIKIEDLFLSTPSARRATFCAT